MKCRRITAILPADVDARVRLARARAGVAGAVPSESSLLVALVTIGLDAIERDAATPSPTNAAPVRAA